MLLTGFLNSKHKFYMITIILNKLLKKIALGHS